MRIATSWIVMSLLTAIFESSQGHDHYKALNNNYKINKKPCLVNGLEGTCMFVYECINSKGRHIGMCVDTFMFGSCCAHNLTTSQLAMLPDSSEPAVLFTQPGVNSVSQKPVRPHHRPHRPSQVMMRPNNVDSDSAASVSAVDKKYHYHSSSTPQPHLLNRIPSTNFISNNRPNFMSRPAALPSQHIITSTAISTTNTNSQSQQVDDNENKVDSNWSHRPNWNSNSGNHHSFITKPKPQTHLKPYYSHTTSTTTTTTTTSSTTTPKPTTTTSTTTTLPLPSTTEVTLSTTSKHDAVDTITVVSTIKPEKHTAKPGVSAETNQKSIPCGSAPLHPRHEIRIVGGRNAAFGSWPWQVSVRRTSFFGFSSTHRCGGALLNENWIATAGHCVDDLLTSQIRIRVGEYDFSSEHEPYKFAERAVAKKVVHPKYNFFTYEYDLAMVRLDSPLQYAPHIVPICLPGSDDLLIGENATVTGWGRLSEGGTLPSVLQEVNVPIVSNDKCKSMFLRAGRHEYIPEIFMCAGFDDGGRDSCQGDSGGPLQVKGRDGRYFLAGIISWGIGCAEANLPGVCTRISKFVPWILETVT
ncbi:serine proteinase stubble [Daktulosphaira vitifoliae]|uniref:serine proteinase stubble n=1 Tax=Daktulosphaira vitifoliae TaxID=58002 RepID=UPI0021A9D8F5|nr:serine proteinase stubble [Daktulosphaira vitifoliae]XP_050543260.1 serine proteinase stubble [Daktulosphaira vitifoliae]